MPVILKTLMVTAPPGSKANWACFSCRKSFKHAHEFMLWRPLPQTAGGRPFVSCPQCGGAMHNMGKHFKAPPQRDHQGWEKVRLLLRHGYTYTQYDCPSPRPAHLREVPAFVAEQQRAASRRERIRKAEARFAQFRAEGKTRRKKLGARRSPPTVAE